MRVAIITAVHKRPKVWDLWLRHHCKLFSELSDQHHFSIFVAGDEPQHKKLLNKYCALYDIYGRWIQTPNKPVGRKFNKACQMAKLVDDSRDQKFTHYCIIGSDDLMHKGFILHALDDRVEEEVIVTHEAVVCNINFSKIFIQPEDIVHQHCDLKQTQPYHLPFIGSGRFVRSTIMERLEYTVFSEHNSGLDISFDKRLIDLSCKYYLLPIEFDRDQYLTILKHGENINQWNWFAHLPSIDLPEPKRKYLEHLIITSDL